MTDVPPPPLPLASASGPPKAIATPCIKVCIIDGQSSLCLGCYRKLNEVAAWAKLTDDQRAAIMAELPSRRALISPEKLGLF